MANFEIVRNQLEGIINSQLAAARTNQGVWEWFNALQRITSSNRIGGTVYVYGPASVNDADFVAVRTGAATLWGALVDNSISNEAVWVSALDGDATLTPGTEHQPGVIIHVPAATMLTFVYPSGISYPTTGIAVMAQTGTDAALETTTGVTGTNPTAVLVYTA